MARKLIEEGLSAAGLGASGLGKLPGSDNRKVANAAATLKKWLSQSRYVACPL